MPAGVNLGNAPAPMQKGYPDEKKSMGMASGWAWHKAL